MPFTVSHIALALPARRISRIGAKLPLAGVAVGAMAPDLEYVVQGTTARTVSHTPLGIVTWDLPLALVTLWAAALAAPGLALLVPARWPEVSRRLRAWRLPCRPASIGWLLFAIVLGSATHVFIDAFTHGGRWGTDRVGWLNTPTNILGEQIFIYSWFQRGLSVLGMVILCAMAWRWLMRVQPIETWRSSPGPLATSAQVTTIGVLAIGVALAALAHTVSTLPHVRADQQTVVVLLLGGWRAAAIALFALGCATRLADTVRSRRAGICQ